MADCELCGRRREVAGSQGQMRDAHRHVTSQFAPFSLGDLCARRLSLQGKTVSWNLHHPSVDLCGLELLQAAAQESEIKNRCQGGVSDCIFLQAVGNDKQEVNKTYE